MLRNWEPSIVTIILDFDLNLAAFHNLVPDFPFITKSPTTQSAQPGFPEPSDNRHERSMPLSSVKPGGA
jgi:hypothetical protein